LTKDDLLTRLLELQDFLAVAPDGDSGEFARWHEAVEEVLNSFWGPDHFRDLLDAADLVTSLAAPQEELT
jgi:hypothetical protein